MSLVPFNESYRRTWMLPRNIRYIVPWKVSQILSIFVTLSSGDDDWSGNQILQNKFAKYLEDYGLKRKGYQYDLASGGPRTYRSQLKCLGLIFERDKEVWTTLAGQALLEQNDSQIEILRKQVLDFQYPSAYGNEQNIWMHPKIKVKPFLFILQLLLDPEINYLEDSEIIFPVVYGHNWDCYDLCKNKILEYRRTDDLNSLIEDPDEDLYTRRAKGRKFSDAIKDVKNIANTFKNYLSGVSLVLPCFVPENPKRRAICVNSSFVEYINNALVNKNDFIQVSTPEQYQRRYGLWGAKKDTRNLTKYSQVVDGGRNLILAKFSEYAGKNIVTDIPEEYIVEMNNFGFDRATVVDVIEPHLKQSLSYFEQRFLEIATGGKESAREFEVAVAKLFREKLHFDAKLTGQLKGKGDIGAYSDVLLEVPDRSYCAIVDAKAYKSYDLSHDDYLKMTQTYVSSVGDFGDYDKNSVRFCLYVAGNFSNTIDGRLKMLSNSSGVNLSAIRAFELLKLCQESFTKNDVKRLADIFSSAGLHIKDDFSSLF